MTSASGSSFVSTLSPNAPRTQPTFRIIVQAVAEAQGNKLARVRRQLALAWQPDGVVQRRGDRGVAGSAAHHPGRAALVLSSGDPDGADLAGRVPPRPAPNGRADRLHPPPTWSRSRRARPF